MRADAFHETFVISIIQRPIHHVMKRWIVHDAVLSFTDIFSMHRMDYL